MAAAIDNAIHFVVGTGRCGSTLLSHLLARHTAVLSLSEFIGAIAPDLHHNDTVSGREYAGVLARPLFVSELMLAHDIAPDEVLYRPPVSSVSPLLLATLPLLAPGDPTSLWREIEEWLQRQPERSIASHTAQLWVMLAERNGRRIVVERSGGSAAYLPLLLQINPAAKVIHLHRRGAQCALSMSKQASFRLRVLGQEFQRRFGFDPYVPYGDVPDATSIPEPWRSLMPARFDRSTFLKFDIPIERFGELWSAMMLRVVRDLKTLDRERVLHMSYERLVGSPLEALASIATFLNLERPWDWASDCARSVRPETPSRTADLIKTCALGERALDRALAR